MSQEKKRSIPAGPTRTLPPLGLISLRTTSLACWILRRSSPVNASPLSPPLSTGRFMCLMNWGLPFQTSLWIKGPYRSHILNPLIRTAVSGCRPPLESIRTSETVACPGAWKSTGPQEIPTYPQPEQGSHQRRARPKSFPSIHTPGGRDCKYDQSKGSLPVTTRRTKIISSTNSITSHFIRQKAPPEAERISNPKCPPERSEGSRFFASPSLRSGLRLTQNDRCCFGYFCRGLITCGNNN